MDRIEIVPSPYFDVVCDGRIVTAAPAIMKGGANVAKRQISGRRKTAEIRFLPTFALGVSLGVLLSKVFG